MKRYFLDTEFDPTPGKAPILISLGIVDEDGKEFYAENLDYNPANAHEWIQKNVLPHLTGPAFSEKKIIEMALEFCDKPGAEFYCWVGAYDWFILWDLFAKYQIFPKFMRRDFREIRQLQDTHYPMLDVHSCSSGAAMHNALNDAKWNKAVFEAIQDHTFITI